jgi:hypothetical protein
MNDIFKTPTPSATKPEKVSKRKTKADMDADEYAKVCERMKGLRDKRKEAIKTKKEAPPAAQPEIKVEIREIIKEVPVDRIVDREVIKEVIKEVPVDREVIKEVIKEVQVPAKKEAKLFDDDEDIRSELRVMKKMLHEMRPKQEASKPVDIPKPPPAQKFVFGGVYGGFKPY